MKRTVLILYLTVTFIFGVGFLQAQQGVVVGMVSDTEGPINGATVSIGNKSIVTDANGRFTLSVSSGNYLFQITHVGYKAFTKELIVIANQSQSINVILNREGELGEVVVLGSRSTVRRSNLTTTVPVDVISATQLSATGQVSLTQMLNFSAPSFNASRPLSAEPATLRGLYPDQMLVLVNGTRKHSMAFITPAGLRGLLGPGTVGNDLNSIPFTAVEKIEILRDGAAAQYGSDAIAGVLNIELKKTTGNTNLVLQGGQYYKGDGSGIIAGVNHGIALAKKGYLNLSADFRQTEGTDRGGEYNGTVYTNNKVMDDSIVRARNFDRGAVSNARTSPQRRAGMLMNGGYEIGKNTSLFWTAILNKRRTSYSGNYTLPKTTNRINPELFPDGYMPNIYHYSTDVTGIIGAKGHSFNHWNWEYTSSFGQNTDPWYINNTNNPSQYYTLGKNAPTSFYTGKLAYYQLINNIQLTKQIFIKQIKQTANISLGAEWRVENYQMHQGEEGAWKNFDPLARKLGNSTGLIVYPINEVNKSRSVAAAYIDFEKEFGERLLVNLASRYEYYNDFGHNVAGKLAVRYKPAKNLIVRGSVNNGFRAPSLQQRYYSSTNSSPIRILGVVYPSIAGTFRNDSPIAQALGIPNLTAERSVNFSAGITATGNKHLRLTVDAYNILIKDRIVVSGGFDTTNAVIKDLLRPFPDVTQVLVYANAINTVTRGFDAVLNGEWRLPKGSIKAMLAANFTKTRLFGEVKASEKLRYDSLTTTTLFSRYQRGRLEDEQPRSKVIALLQCTTGSFSAIFRNTRFGKTGIRFNTPATNPDENFSAKILTDVSLTYHTKKHLSITVGANNIFNIYPDPIRHASNTDFGNDIYSKDASPFGFNGGYYFVSAAIKVHR